MVSGIKGQAQAVLVKRPVAFGAEGEGGAGEDGEGGTGGAVDVNELLQNPDIQKFIQAKLDSEVAGLKNKNTELLDKMKKSNEQLKQFEGLDVERLKALQKQMEENEEMRLLSEGKTEEVVNRRVELLKKDYDQQITMREAKLQEYNDLVKQKDEKLRELIVDGAVREAYVGLDFEPTAMDDVIRNARDIFILGEDGKVVPRDRDGNIIFSKDGKTPIDAKGWLETQAEKKPYLRRASRGAGAVGSKGGTTHNDVTTSVGKIAEGLRKQNLGW